MTALPTGFEDLEPYVAKWALADFQTRFDRRYTSDMASIQDFYEAMLPRADSALTALAAQPLDGLGGSWLTLYQLLMSLAHVALAVERHKKPRPANTGYPAAVRLIRGSVPA